MRSLTDVSEWGLWLRSVNEVYDWGQWLRSMTEVSEWGLWQRSVNEITGWGKWTRSMTEVSDWGQWGFVLEYLGIEFWTKDTFPRNCPVVTQWGVSYGGDIYKSFLQRNLLKNTKEKLVFHFFTFFASLCANLMVNYPIDQFVWSIRFFWYPYCHTLWHFMSYGICNKTL